MTRISVLAAVLLLVSTASDAALAQCQTDADCQEGMVCEAGLCATPPPEPAPPRKARLTVAVFPFGEVWIDGKPRGTAPVKAQALRPGVYEISAGQGGPSKTRTVRLRPGEAKTIVFDLTKAD